ncbi:MAG: xanthine dehydrogenase family protein molybdopterin-binding subunit [Acidobacteria bacterium]|nr:MAG: xanthine dehydrogenase family protein molybdopterin-binding subunit [Acidobacteriota bacterium]
MSKKDPTATASVMRPEIGLLDRRRFLQLLGGGVTVLFTVGDPLALAQTGRRQQGEPEDFNAFLRIGEDGRVTCFSGKIEMGQGIYTSLAQMAADELGVPLSSVDMVMGDTDLCPWDGGTFGSRSTREYGLALRQAAAEAKAVLLELAAERLAVSLDTLSVRDGVVVSRGNAARRVSYAELARGQKIQRRLSGTATVKPRNRHTVSGQPTARADSRVKVTGEAQFTGDIRPAGMLCAKILRPPTHGATLNHVDISGAERIEGVRVIEDGDLIAVLHEHPDVAEKALRKVRADFDNPRTRVDNSNIFDHLLASAPEPELVTEQGNLNRGRRLAVNAFESRYYNHYVAHAPIEPHTAVAQIEGNKATIWASTQTPFRARDAVASLLGLPTENVRVITPFVGGGFGGKGRNQQVMEAARLARLARRPVQIAWSREEEFFFDSFRPAAVVELRSGLDGDNRITFWDYDVRFAGRRSSEPIYEIPHYRVLSRGSWREGSEAHPFKVGAWRAPASNTNVFAMESQVDIMAAAAGVNPLEFRLANLTDERMRRVLGAAAESFGRAFAPAPSGRGYGIACTNYQGTYVATMAKVLVNKRVGQVRVERVVCAQDMGEVINPKGAQQQIEGCITMGLGYALSEELRFKGGEILDQNFDTYQLPRFSWLPRIRTVLVDNPDLGPQGCGEPAITPMGAVVANAVFDAVGARVYELPMTPERVKAAVRRS